MKLVDPSFVRRVRRRVRQEVKRDPAMRRQSRLAKRVSRALLGRALLFFLPILILAALAVQGNPVVTLCGLAIWAAINVLHRAGSLQAFIIGKVGLAPFYTQPVEKEFVYAYGWRDFLRGSLGLFFVGLVVFSILVSNSGQGWAGVARGTACAALLWITTIAAAVILFRHWPAAPFGKVGGLATTACFLLIIATDKMRYLAQLGIAESAYPALRAFTPGGWICSLAEWGLGITTQFPIVGALLAAALIGYAITVESTLRREFTFFEGDIQTYSPVDEERPGAVDEIEIDSSAAPATPMEVAPDEIAATLRKALSPVALNDSGWIERLILRGFSPREFVVLNFLVGGAPEWTRRYRRGALILIVLLGIFQLISAVAGTQPLTGTGMGWIYWITSAVAVLHMTPIFSGIWVGFEVVSVGNRGVAFLSMLPVGVSEARRIMLRINRWRLLLASPWIIATVFTFTRLHNGVQESIGIAIVSVALLWAILPIGILFQFSPTTSDNTSASWFKLLMIAVFLFLAICGLLTIFFVLTGEFVLCAAGVVIFAVVTHCLYAFYFYRYRKLRFDTMAALQV